MEDVLETDEATQLRERFRYLAWRWYRIPPQEAADIVQAALVTFLEKRHRYPKQDEHMRILHGIFRNKCREHIDQAVRAGRHRKTLEAGLLAGTVSTPVAPKNGDTATEGVLDELVRSEDYCLILEALAELPEPAREMFRLLVHEGKSRAELIELFGVNKNTWDWRVHDARKRLRERFSREGLDV